MWENATNQANGTARARSSLNSTGNATSKWPKNLQKRSLSSSNIIGQLSQLTEHKIRAVFDSVHILELDFFISWRYLHHIVTIKIFNYSFKHYLY